MDHAMVDDPQVSDKPFWFVEKDGGFTSVGVVIALTLTLALLFTTAQVYWTNSTAGDIQFAADAGALAAENVVAEYYVVARIADAVVLSMSLFGLVVFGVAIVVSCIPYFQETGAKIMEFGYKVFKARDKIAKESKEALTKLQKALPFLAAMNAYSAIHANSFSQKGEASYRGIAILVPLKGDEVEYPDDSLVEEKAHDLEEQNQETSEATDAAEDQKKDMDEAKLQGYMADCGKDPGYCMYERTKTLTSLSGTQNPKFSSVKTWEFDYAMKRAKAYYQDRLANEAPAKSSVKEQAHSYIRKLFYEYAVEEMNKGYAHTDADGVLDAYFPRLAHTVGDIKGTKVGMDPNFPFDEDSCMHAYPLCPGISGNIAGYGSLIDLDAGLYTKCSTCGMSSNAVGKVASATTNTETGFEYHYLIVADAAERYQPASKEHKSKNDQAKELANKAFDTYSDALEALKSKRFDPKPPGRSGCIVIAFDPSSHAVPAQFSSRFVKNDTKLPARMAISAAALVDDGASEGDTILSSFLDRVDPKLQGETGGLSFLDVFDKILGVWGNVLLVYSQGADSMAQGLGDFIQKIPIVGDTPLASWAQKTLQETIEGFGLQGVKLSAPKPVVVNSIHVIDAGDSQALSAIGKAKQGYSSIPGSGSGTLMDGVTEGLMVEIENQGDAFLESEFTIYTISFGDFPGVPEIPIKIKLPQMAIDSGKSFISDSLDNIREMIGGWGSGSVWE